MNVLVDRKLPEQQPGARDNSVLCVPLMGSEDRLTACLVLIVPMAKNTPVKRAGRHVAGLHTGTGKRHWSTPSPHPIDIHVGLRIRQRRRLLGMSQEKLGAVVGVSFQMIQRYECGSTGIPVSSLFELANALNVHPLLLFQGPRLRAKDPLCARETIELVHAYLAIHDPTVRASVAETIRAIATTPLSRRSS
jgi:transcriptional regulator with XRE-family HTH domain